LGKVVYFINYISFNSSVNNQTLENGIDISNLNSGEYAPIASNESSTGKAKNRRIEVILTPKLDEISKLLNEI